MEAFYMAITGILSYLWLNQVHVETDLEFAKYISYWL